MVQKKTLINYWNSFYKKNSISSESTFAKFTYRKIKKFRGKILDIGCGNGRDAYFFNKKGFNVLGVDISQKAIQINSKDKIKNLIFKRFDVGKDKLKSKFEIIYCRFFVHTLDEMLENKLINIIKINKKKKKKKKKKILWFFLNLEIIKIKYLEILNQVIIIK